MNVSAYNHCTNTSDALAFLHKKAELKHFWRWVKILESMNFQMFANFRLKFSTVIQSPTSIPTPAPTHTHSLSLYIYTHIYIYIHIHIHIYVYIHKPMPVRDDHLHMFRSQGRKAQLCHRWEGVLRLSHLRGKAAVSFLQGWDSSVGRDPTLWFTGISI